MGDTRGAIAWLSEQSFADAGKIGITGFCWGGSVVWMSAALIPEIKAGVAWYGPFWSRRPIRNQAGPGPIMLAR